MDASPSPAAVELVQRVETAASQFIAHSETLRYRTEHALQFIDITDHLRAAVDRAAIAHGQLSVSSAHTTAAIVINENEPLLLNDMARVLARFAPADDYYEHNDFSIRTVNMHDEEPANGHAHCQHLLLGTSETIPIQAGELRLGNWQRCFLVELDDARQREVFVQLIGVAASA